MAFFSRKGEQSRFISGTNIEKHREWRGLKDTWYDYTQWIKLLGIVMNFVAVSPARITRGLLEYRWMGNFLAAFNMRDRCVEGLRGPALRVAHEDLCTIMAATTTQIGQMMKGDRRFGENSFGRRIVFLEQTMPPEIMAGFPKLIPIPLEVYQGLLSCYMDQNSSPYYIDVMENAGLPADSCRLSANATGVALNDDFPKAGACVIANNMPCDSSTMNSQVIERRLDVPVLTAEVPMRWEDRNTDQYSLVQMKRIIKFVEDSTGESFDEDAFWTVIGRHNQEVANEMEKWEYMKTPYTPIACTVSILYHAFYFTFSGGRNPSVVRTDEKVLKIAKRCYDEKTAAFPKTRHRAIMWGGPACYWLQFPNWLYNCWGILVVAGMDNFSGNVTIPTGSVDEALVGIARNHETGVMRRHLTGGWEHLVEFWAEAEKFNCDMVILNNDITCKGALGLTGVILDQAKEKQQHLMLVSNDMFNHVTISRADMRKEVNDYMTAVMQEQPLDASLMEYDDYEGW